MANESTPAEGDKAPDFTLPATANPDGILGLFSLADNGGNGIVLFFYPKDDTTGCTREAIEFSLAQNDFTKLAITVVGVSPDSLKKHVRFRDKHDLGVRLVADEDKTALLAYGVWKEKSMYGKKYIGVERSTFLIDKFGCIAKVWRRVAVPGHVTEVLEAAKSLVKFYTKPNAVTGN